MRKIVSLALALAAMAGCDTNEQLPGSAADRVAARFTDAAITRASATAWEAGDKIGVYMLPQGTVLTDAAVLAEAKNICHEMTDVAEGTFTPVVADELIYFPIDGSQVDFYAYYPYRTDITNGIYKIDVSDQTKPAAIDLMTSSAVNKDKSDPVASFSFGHRMSKLLLNITPGVGFTATDLAGMTVRIKGLPVTADFFIGAPSISNVGPTTTLVAKVNPAGTVVEAIVIPQAAIPEGSVQLLFTLTDGRIFTWDLPNTADRFDISFDSEGRYLYNLSITTPGVKLMSQNITPWRPEVVPDGGSAEEVIYYSVGDYYPDPAVTFSAPGVVQSGTAPVGIVYWLENPNPSYVAATGSTPAKGRVGKILSVSGHSEKWPQGPSWIDGLPTIKSMLWNMASKDECREVYNAWNGSNDNTGLNGFNQKLADSGNPVISPVKYWHNQSPFVDNVDGNTFTSYFYFDFASGEDGQTENDDAYFCAISYFDN